MREEKAQNKRYRLYDEHLVRNIMLSTALSVIEYLRESPHADYDEICDFIDANTENIISDTVRHLKSIDELPAKDGEDDNNDNGDEWLSNDKE
jgi:hypothetical protein